jgi:cysteine desulfurase/selenocysteine lyase
MMSTIFSPEELQKIREDFPILHQNINHHPLVYLDNAASTQKPNLVIDAISNVYREHYSNIHRGVHTLSQRCTDLYEASREKVRNFINAKSTHEVIFVRGTTEAVNLVAQTYGRSNIGEGDEVLITAMEHHSNIVPWQLLCEQTGATLRAIPIDETGQLELVNIENLFRENTKLLSLTHMSNALGTINPVKTLIDAAHQRNIPVLLDGAQSAPHMKIDVQDLDCDFFCFSGHKLYGPSGIGILYGKEAFLEAMPPYQGGGDMIRYVTLEKSDFNTLPHKFEAGTPNIADTIGLGAAIDYLESIGMERIAQHENALLLYATGQASAFPSLKIIGTSPQKGALLSFTLKGVHPHDIGTLLDFQGIAIRAGHHCAMPVMDFFQVPATARASFGIYNTTEEVDQLFSALEKLTTLFK